MKRSRFTEEQMIAILKESDVGAKTEEICRRHEISTATFYAWRKNPGGMEASDAKKLRSLEDENAKLKKLLENSMLDNGPEGASRAMFERSERTGVRLRFIEPGKPVQNAFVENFNVRFRDKCLNQHWFRSLRHARDQIFAWRRQDNHERPNSALGYRAPIEFLAAQTTAAPENPSFSRL